MNNIRNINTNKIQVPITKSKLVKKVYSIISENKLQKQNTTYITWIQQADGVLEQIFEAVFTRERHLLPHPHSEPEKPRTVTELRMQANVKSNAVPSKN